MNWRIVAVSASIAFILSFISGLAGGVSFTGILLKAVIGSVLFGGFTAGLMTVLERFLPDLAGVLFRGTAPDTQPDTAPEGIDIVVPEEGLPEDMYRGEENAEADESLALEVGELSGEEPVAGVAGVKPIPDTGPPDILDSIDVLPDLDSFSGSFVSTETSEPEQPVIPTRNSPAQTDSFDPDTIAKAVQTLLKRDQEGKGNYGR